MAERRMFARSVIDSDAFLDMPLTAQALYFHLGMQGDDDGFVGNPKRTQRAIGAADDDMRLLLAKGFIYAFDSGVIVIRHWKMHNYIQSDRYRPTQFSDEKALLLEEKGKQYRLASELDTSCIHVVSSSDTGCTRSIGKVSIGEVSIGESGAASPPAKPSRTRFEPPTGDMVREYMQHYAEQKGMTVNAADQAERFVDHFAANGWKVSGKSSMQDWQASARNWLRNAKQFPETQPPAQTAQQPMRFASDNLYGG